MHWRSAGETTPDPQATRDRSCSAPPGVDDTSYLFPGPVGQRRLVTAALCPKRAGESLTDVKEMENRKPWRHKKVPMDAIRSSRIWSRKVEEELCYGASQACFEGEASK
jgi:hypothetical protein